MSPQVAADIVALVDEFSPVRSEGLGRADARGGNPSGEFAAPASAVQPHGSAAPNADPCAPPI